MTSVFHRKLNRQMPIAVKGEGIWITDQSGKSYLDAGSSGAGMTCLGHSHPRVVEAVSSQVGKLAFMHGAYFSSEPIEALADEMVRHAPSGLTRVFFLSGGSEAVESALMMARQTAIESGQPERRQIISRKNSFHGATLTTLTVGDATGRRAPFEGFVRESIKIGTPYSYRTQLAQESEEQYGMRLAQELEDAILQAGPDTVLAFIAETVGGSSSGALLPPTGYFRRIREICDRYGVRLILDEVYCGLGRTGTLHACNAEGVRPDLLVMAKGLAAGYAPIGAILVTDAIHDTIANGSGDFKGGFTHSGHALACAAALAVQRTVREEGLVDNVVRQGLRLKEALSARFANHPHVGDIRGRGLLQAIELVADRDAKTPFERNAKLAPRLAQETMQRGLLCVPAAGTIDGVRGEHVLLAPPFIVTDNDIDEIVARLGDAVDAATLK